MPRLSCWFIRASLLYLATGFTLGALLLIHKGIPLHAALWRVLPAHIEFLLLGWTLQLAMGTAFWILPRFQQGRARGNEALAWCAFGLLNGGVCLVGLSWMLGGARMGAVAGPNNRDRGSPCLCCACLATGQTVRHLASWEVDYGARRLARSAT